MAAFQARRGQPGAREASVFRGRGSCTGRQWGWGRSCAQRSVGWSLPWCTWERHPDTVVAVTESVLGHLTLLDHWTRGQASSWRFPQGPALPWEEARPQGTGSGPRAGRAGVGEALLLQRAQWSAAGEGPELWRSPPPSPVGTALTLAGIGHAERRRRGRGRGERPQTSVEYESNCKIQREEPPLHAGAGRALCPPPSHARPPGRGLLGRRTR